MLFNTPEFVVFFIAVITVISCLKFRKFQHLFLVGASYFFFYISNNFLISLLIYSTLLDFYLGKAIYNSKNQKNKKILLMISLAGNLGLLGFFKYANFMIDEINKITQTLGISNIDYEGSILGGPIDKGFDSYFGVDVPNFPPYTWFQDDRLTDIPTVNKPAELYGNSGLAQPGWKLENMIPEFTRRVMSFIESKESRGGTTLHKPFFLYFNDF